MFSRDDNGGGGGGGVGGAETSLGKTSFSKMSFVGGKSVRGFVTLFGGAFRKTSGEGGVTFRLAPGVVTLAADPAVVAGPKLFSSAQSSPKMASRSCSSVSSKLMREYRYESNLGDSTRGVDILLMWTVLGNKISF